MLFYGNLEFFCISNCAMCSPALINKDLKNGNHMGPLKKKIKPNAALLLLMFPNQYTKRRQIN